MTNLSRMQLAKLGDVADILTPLGFKRKFPIELLGEKLIEYVYVPNKYSHESFEICIAEGSAVEKGYAIIPKNDKVSLVYILAYLNSATGLLYITNNELYKNSQLTYSALNAIPIRIIKSEYQNAFAFLQLMIFYLKTRNESNDTDRYDNYRIELFAEIRDAISMQIMVPKLFDTFDVEVLGNWTSTLSACAERYPNLKRIEMAERISELLLDSNSPVINNVRKFRFVLDSLSKQFNKKRP